MSHAIEQTLEMTEGTTPDFTTVLLDNNNQSVAGSVLDTLTLTYYQEYTHTIINGRNVQNVLQANGITVDEDGNLLWELSLLDTVILNDALATEPHIAFFEFSWPGALGTEVNRKEYRFLVDNVQRDAS